ncbi:hypothetical protein FA15DRAFT_117890 [Coprinopsis marcescibilis]|uniref:Uncharacterized protein n=1 Tax=Coprinopsis marcescibilis TaxID=230819 RepID=A0A5C3L6W8_COPMA|nr:hypothetical protein FA15DRAFT_117890 [Coprinopsis marcescibilis]
MHPVTVADRFFGLSGVGAACTNPLRLFHIHLNVSPTRSNPQILLTLSAFAKYTSLRLPA